MFLLQDVFEWRSREDPGKEAIRDTSGRVLTLGDLDSKANRIAGALVAAGLHQGDRIAVLANNCLEYLAIYLAAAKAGVVLVPLNYRLTPREWISLVNDAQARLMIAQAEYVDSVVAARDELKTVEHVVALGATTPQGCLDFEEWISDQPESAPMVESASGDDLIQMYTSGTTGLPKGVLLTHESIVNNMVQLVACETMPAGSRVQVVAPLYHVAAACGCFNALFTGGSIYLHEKFVPDEVVRVLDEEGIGATFLPPALIQAILDGVPDVSDRKYEQLRRIIYGASPITEETLRRGMEVFGCDFCQSYGQTEGGALTYLSPADHRRALSEGKPERLRSCGRSIPATELKIVDDEDIELPAYETGEIIARGPQLMRGYWKQPDETAKTLRNGWLHTGDAGYFDDEGYLYIKDRIKDMIVSGGENVYPGEVEQALSEHPAVAEAAVIGIPDHRWGEAVHGVVQLEPGAHATADEIIDFCRERLAGFKRPRSVEFIVLIPRNASGKVLKRELRAPYWEGRDREV